MTKDLDKKIIELMDLFDGEVTTADKIDRPERALEKEARQANYEWKIVVPSKAKVIDFVMTSDGAATFIQPRKEL